MFIRTKAVTLIELLIALVLIGIITLALSNIDIFSRFQVRTADRRAKVQNEALLVLEHIAKHLVRTTGNEMLTGANSVIFVAANDPPVGDSDKNRLNFFADSGNDGIGDQWRGYRYRNTGANRNQILYCDSCAYSRCTDPASDTCCDPCLTQQVIATNIKGFMFMSVKPTDAGGRLNDNAIPVSVRACWDASGAIGASGSGSDENPCVNLNTRITMPSVSTN